MGIFSSIGKFIKPISAAVGAATGQPWIGAVGGAVGDRLDANRARKQAYGREDSRIQRLVKDARAAGIHPLAALGSPVSSSPVTPIGSTVTGDAIGDFYQRRQAKDQLQLAKENAAADRDLKREMLNQEKLKTSAMIADAQSRTEIMRARQAGTQGPVPLWVKYRDRDGNIHWGPNPDLPDLEQFPSPALIQGVTNPVVGGKRKYKPPQGSPPSRPSFPLR